MGLRVQILAQLHDGLYFQYRLADNDNEVIAQAKQLAEDIPLTHTLKDGSVRVFKVPYDSVTGFNWAHRYRRREDGNVEDWNPKGLDKFKLAA